MGNEHGSSRLTFGAISKAAGGDTRGLELRALVAQAWELEERSSPYLLDAAAAIVDWHERRYLRFLEREQEELDRLVLLLRDTNPDRTTA